MTSKNRSTRLKSNQKILEEVNFLPESSRKIGEWQENVEEGTWAYENDEISAYVSFWRHLEIKGSCTACIRWVYPKGSEQNYATYTKIYEVDCDIENLLMSVGAFISNWLEKEKEKNDSQNKPRDKEKT